MLQGYRERCDGVPKVGIGHGIGGSILLAPEVNAYFDGVVLISVPLTYAGTSVATQTLLNATGDWSWRDLVGFFAVPMNFAGSTTMEEVVMTNRHTTAERFEFYRVESSRLPSAFRQGHRRAGLQSDRSSDRSRGKDVALWNPACFGCFTVRQWLDIELASGPHRSGSTGFSREAHLHNTVEWKCARI